MYKYVVARTGLENCIYQYLEVQVLEESFAVLQFFFCFAIVVNDEVLAYFKHDVCIFIHGTSKIECFVICKISFVNVIKLSVNVHV